MPCVSNKKQRFGHHASDIKAMTHGMKLIDDCIVITVSWYVCQLRIHSCGPIYQYMYRKELCQTRLWHIRAGALTHWGWVTHICVGNLTIIGSDNGLSPGRRQAIIWTNAGILLIGPLGTNFSEILIEIRIFSFKKMDLKVSSAKWRPFCLGLNELNVYTWWHISSMNGEIYELYK